MLLPSSLPEHPRLLARTADWDRLKHQIERDAPSKILWQTLLHRADAICDEPPVERVLTGRRLLMVSRQALERISVLAIVDRITGKSRFGARAIEELIAISGFADWNPSHFLDTAELCLAVSIGYDWVHDQLEAAQRDRIAVALVEKGLQPSLDATVPGNWWLETDENWVQVCHGGLAAAAIVLADRQPVLAEAILARALAALPKVAANYAPDGAYPEGPMYWNYGTSYHVVLAAALSRLTGSAQGTDSYPGFAESAEYINRMTAPSGGYFNYADCAERRRLQPPLFWMAAHFKQPALLSHDLLALEHDLAEYRDNPSEQYWYYDMVALALLWRQPAAAPPEAEAGNRTWSGRGPMPVAVYRWGAGRCFLGIKGGSVGLSHSHMDVGSFVFEAAGERWAVDTGMQDYDSLERAGVDLWNEKSQDSQRWMVFRIGPESHNILRFEHQDQLLFRTGTLSPSNEACAVDVSALYGPAIQTANRRFTLDPDGFSLEDRWQAPAKVVAISQWLTLADVTHEGSTIMLAQHGKLLRIDVESSVALAVTIEDFSKAVRSFDAPNPGLTRISIRSEGATEGSMLLSARIA